MAHPTSANPPRVALVGHCGPDAWMLKNTVARALPGADIAMVNDLDTARRHALNANLLLINRVLDGDFDSDAGLELIHALIPLPARRATMMLVSNFPDAQQQAVALGAAPGFGKSTAGRPETADLLRAAVAKANPP